MTRSIFSIILLVIFLGNGFCLRCYHCRQTENVRCIHPENYYPPLAYCGGTSAWCAALRLGLKATKSSLWMSFGDSELTRWATYKGCAKLSFCTDFGNKSFGRVGLKVISCNICKKDYCNSARSNVVSFVNVKLFVFYYLISCNF